MFEITAAPIELEALVRAVRTDACGAVVTFAGVVRETSADDPRLVRRIAYEAYPALALAQLLYQDGSHAEVLVQRNAAPHPLFMPLIVEYLAA